MNEYNIWQNYKVRVDSNLGRSYENQYLTIELNRILSNAAVNPFPNAKILDFSKLKEFADDNFKFDENGRKLSL